MAAVAAAVAGVLHPLPRRPGRHLRPDRTAPSGAASRRARAVARRRDRPRNGRRDRRATRRCRVRPRLSRPHRAPLGCSDFVPVRRRCAARRTNPACSVGCHSHSRTGLRGSGKQLPALLHLRVRCGAHPVRPRSQLGAAPYQLSRRIQGIHRRSRLPHGLATRDSDGSFRPGITTAGRPSICRTRSGQATGSPDSRCWAIKGRP